MKEILKWFLIIFVGLWLFWFFTGGPNRTTSRGGTFIKPPNPIGNSWKTYNKDSFPFLKRNSSNDSTIEDSLEKIQKMAGVSIYKDKVTLGYGNAKRNNVDQEYLILESSRKNEGRIGISGWVIQSVTTGKSVTIGKASYLPYTATVNTQEPVFISPGDKVYITTGRSPIGTSFRTNICTGYFEQFQDFNPYLKKNCPRPEDESDFVLYGNIPMNDQCIDFVEDIPRCEINIDPLPANMQYECSAYIGSKINYNTCVSKYKNNEGFFGSEWRIYLRNDSKLWKQRRESLRLLDAEGKLVDTITY